MAGGVAIEHSHRLFASAVGLSTIFLAVALYRQGQGRIGLLAVALVVVQGLLGGLTVIFKLPDLVSTAHLAVSMLFFLVLLWTTWFTKPDRESWAVPARTMHWLGVAALVVYLQIVLGALVRHTESGLACGGWVLCHGSLWPDVHPSARLHMLHRFGAVVVAALVMGSALAIWRLRPLWARWMALLVVAQIALGLAAVQTGLSLWAVQGHLAVAAALLACCFWVRLGATRT